MKVKKLDHIGLITTALEEVLPVYTELLGLECHGEEILPGGEAKTVFIPCGDVELELLAATSPDSQTAQYFKAKGPGIDHFALEVDDINEAVEYLKSKGVKMVDQVPRPGAGGSMIAFISPEDAGGISLELCEKPKQ